jgi:hypothetical protein
MVHSVTRRNIPVVVTGTHCAEAQLEALFSFGLLGCVVVTRATQALNR